MPLRLNKFLADAGIASRRKAEVLIAEGRVTVNDLPVTSPAFFVEEYDKVLVDGKPVITQTSPKLWIYHKPVGQICTHDDPQHRQTVFAALPQELGRVISVGRLDINSEGALLLTNSGDVARYLEHPANAFERVYRVRVYGKPDANTLKALTNGATIDGISYQPAMIMLEQQRQEGKNCWLRVTLREGKNREIRRMFEHFGYPVNRLIRLSYAGIALGSLPVGQLRDETAALIRLIP